MTHEGALPRSLPPVVAHDTVLTLRMFHHTDPMFLSVGVDRAAERRNGFIGESDGSVHFPGSSHGTVPHDKGRQLSDRGGASRTLSRVPAVAARPKVHLAEWRKRVHAARRRVMLLLITMLRLRRGHKHPVRLPRLDDMSFFIPVQLSGDKASFIKELLKYVATRRQVGIE